MQIPTAARTTGPVQRAPRPESRTRFRHPAQVPTFGVPWFPRGIDASLFVAVRDLEPLPDAAAGTWLATGDDPQFLASCSLPAGWVRMRLKMTSDAGGLLEFHAVQEGGDSAPHCIERAECREVVDRDFYVYFPRPVTGLRFDPTDRPGSFRLEMLRVEPVSPPRALAHAFWSKLRLLRKYRQTRVALWRGLTYLARGRLGHFRKKLLKGLSRASLHAFHDYDVDAAYQEWLGRNRLTDADRECMRREAEFLSEPPRVSVLLPVAGASEKDVRDSVESVLGQIYPYWELWLATQDRAPAGLRRLVEEISSRDRRIRLVEGEGVAASLNSALAEARGDFVALVDPGARLAEHALFKVARAVSADRDLDMVYGDEDRIDADGRHTDPFFKPDWSPEYFLSTLYACGLGVYRTALVRDLGGFRSGFEEALEPDLALRVAARTSRVGHVADVLYHRPAERHAPGETAPWGGQRLDGVRRALESHFRDLAYKASLEPGPGPLGYRVRFALAGTPRVSIIIPTAYQEREVRGEVVPYVERCVESILRKTTYARYEILLLDNGNPPPELARRFAESGIRRVAYAQPFNWSAAMNQGASLADGSHLLFLNDDTEVLTPDWLESLLEYAQQPDIGAVGARLLFPDGRVQHAGVTILDGHPLHAFAEYPVNHPGYHHSNVVPRNYSAVTGACLMTRADVFRAVGGFDEGFALNYNDIDYCLKVVTAGWRIVCTPYAVLDHHEAATKGTVFHRRELNAFRRRWGGQRPRDPYYNPNLSTRCHDFRIAGAEHKDR